MLPMMQLLLTLTVVTSAGTVAGTSARLLLESALGKSVAVNSVQTHGQNGSVNDSSFLAPPTWRPVEMLGSAGGLIGASAGGHRADVTLRRVRRGFIFPGTVWCGAGTNANGYDELGELAETDRCCRDHDHCPHLIGAFEYKYGYRNYRWHTILHCDCDTSFKQCLRDCNDTASRNVGQAYFNIIGMPCFAFQYEQRCTERTWWGKCLNYEEVPVAHVQNQKPFDYEGIEVSSEVENNNVDPTDGDPAAVSNLPLEVTTATEPNHQLPATTGEYSPPKTTESKPIQPSVTFKGGARKNKQRHGKKNRKHGRKSMRGFGQSGENSAHLETNEVRVNSTLRQHIGPKRRGGKRRGQQKKLLGRKKGTGKYLSFEPLTNEGLNGRGQYGAVNAGEVDLRANIFEEMSNSVSLPTVQPKRFNRLRKMGRRNGRRNGRGKANGSSRN